MPIERIDPQDDGSCSVKIVWKSKVKDIMLVCFLATKILEDNVLEEKDLSYTGEVIKCRTGEDTYPVANLVDMSGKRIYICSMEKEGGVYSVTSRKEWVWGIKKLNWWVGNVKVSNDLIQAKLSVYNDSGCDIDDGVVGYTVYGREFKINMPLQNGNILNLPPIYVKPGNDVSLTCAYCTKENIHKVDKFKKLKGRGDSV